MLASAVALCNFVADGSFIIIGILALFKFQVGLMGVLALKPNG
jgi:hypothetical protein